MWFCFLPVAQALTGIAITPNAEMISAGRLRKSKRGPTARPEPQSDAGNAYKQIQTDIAAGCRSHYF
jgi:hypothetical protein